MSNLGGYQIMVSATKKVGGPKLFIGLVMAVGGVIGSGITAGVNAIKNRKEKKKEENKIATTSFVYTVHTNGVINEGLNFKAGDRFAVLKTVGDVVLVELQGDDNNPYVVSEKILSSISNYKKGEENNEQK